ncbi:MAG: ATP-binding cassette domain-containing protein [Acidobacteria bacterium]|nr:ATP-binding cassette domain-containing protein [Acidobacteriota bacterium]
MCPRQTTRSFGPWAIPQKGPGSFNRSRNPAPVGEPRCEISVTRAVGPAIYTIKSRGLHTGVVDVDEANESGSGELLPTGAPAWTDGNGARAGPYIAFRHVSKAFGDKHVLDDVSFEVLTGETVCILGRSGVGKSVALQHILGFLKPDSGRIIVAYEDITNDSEDELARIRKKITMIFQNGALFDSLTVGENVAFPLRERHDLREEQILEIVSGLLEMVGVKEMAGQLPAELSTGMKRSVAIARALASQPECILYDEPTTMVDPLMGQLLGDLMKRLKSQLHLTSVVVTHDMRLAKKLADRVVFLHESKVLFFGSYGDMEKCQEPIVQEFLELDAIDLGA